MVECCPLLSMPRKLKNEKVTVNEGDRELSIRGSRDGGESCGRKLLQQVDYLLPGRAPKRSPTSRRDRNVSSPSEAVVAAGLLSSLKRLQRFPDLHGRVSKEGVGNISDGARQKRLTPGSAASRC